MSITSTYVFSIVVTASILLGLSGCNLCSEEIVQSTTNPTGHVTGIIHVRNCGATTDYVTFVRLHSVKHRPDLDSGEGLVFAIVGRHDVRLCWTEPETLTLKCTNCQGGAVVLRKMARWSNIRIQYDFAPTDRHRDN